MTNLWGNAEDSWYFQIKEKSIQSLVQNILQYFLK